MEWDSVYKEPNDVMECTRVENGTVYRNRYAVGGSSSEGFRWFVSMVFVPDPEAPPPAQQAHAKREHHK